jgi:hypothetical protein
MALTMFMQNFTRSGLDKQEHIAELSKYEDVLLEKALASYNLELLVANTISYMTPELLKNR